MTLRDLGLDATAEAVYRCLLDAPDLPRTELAERLGRDEPHVAAAIEALTTLRLIRPDGIEPNGVQVRDPAVALGSLIERVEDDLLRRHRRVGDTRTELAVLTALFHRQDRDQQADNGIERVEDLSVIRDRLEELAFFTRTSVWSVQPGGPQSPASLAASRPLDIRGLQRGIDMRIIFESGVAADEANREYLREMSVLGARIRLTDEPIERLVIMDGTVAVVPTDPSNSRLGALIVRQPGLLAGFVNLFNRIWAQAHELDLSGSSTTVDANGPSELDLRLLGLMSSGTTDDAAARELGISVRHLRRRVAGLLARLAASSRFEAGVEAARRGWV